MSQTELIPTCPQHRCLRLLSSTVVHPALCPPKHYLPFLSHPTHQLADAQIPTSISGLPPVTLPALCLLPSALAEASTPPDSSEHCIPSVIRRSELPEASRCVGGAQMPSLPREALSDLACVRLPRVISCHQTRGCQRSCLIPEVPPRPQQWCLSTPRPASGDSRAESPVTRQAMGVQATQRTGAQGPWEEEAGSQLERREKYR